MTVKHLFPAVEPSLNLDFANSKKLDPRITFTRSSTGTYVDSNGLIKTAAANEARFDHDGATGSSLGLLVEESRTNSIKHSENLVTSPWQAPVNSTLSLSTELAPDGTATAYKYTATSSSNYLYYLNAGPTTSTAATLSFWVKNISATSANVGVLDTSPVSWIINPNHAGSNYISEINTNGWIRVERTFTVGSAPVHVYPIYGVNDGGELLIWGVQLETGSFPTSYIRTTGSTVTRSADVASMTGTNFSSWWSSGPSTYYANFFSRSTDQNNRAILGIGQSNSEREVQFSVNPTRAQINTRVNNVFYSSIFDGPALGRNIKVAGSIEATRVKISVNGVLGNEVNPPRFASSSPTFMDIGRFLSNSSYTLNGTISRLTYYPYRLTDAQLQALTL